MPVLLDTVNPGQSPPIDRRASVERNSLRLFGLTDSPSKLHRALLAETPAPSPVRARHGHGPPVRDRTATLDVDPSHQRDVERARLHEERRRVAVADRQDGVLKL